MLDCCIVVQAKLQINHITHPNPSCLVEVAAGSKVQASK